MTVDQASQSLDCKCAITNELYQYLNHFVGKRTGVNCL